MFNSTLNLLLSQGEDLWKYNPYARFLKAGMVYAVPCRIDSGLVQYWILIQPFTIWVF